MTVGMQRLLYWTPRVLAIAVALFFSVFALDAFSEGRPIGEALTGFVLHLIPAFVVIAALGLAWKWEWVGATLFGALGILYVVEAHGRFPFTTILLVAGPLFVIALLFLANWLWRRKIRERRPAT